MSTHTTNFRDYVKTNFNQGQGNNYDLIFPIWFTETMNDPAQVKASPSANLEDDSYHRAKNTIYFELNYPGSEITSCRMVVFCDDNVRVLQQSDGEGTGYSQGNGRLLLSGSMANNETSHFTLKNGKNRFIFEVSNTNNTYIHGGPGFLLACAVTSDATNNNLIFHTGHTFCRWGGYTAATNPTYDSLGQGWKWKNGFFTNTDAPVLSGVPGNVTIKDNESYTIPTVTATDTTDGSVTVTISNGGFTTNGTSSHTTGSYTITFTATDSNSITTTSSYVLTVETSAIYFPMGPKRIFQSNYLNDYGGIYNNLLFRICFFPSTYDPYNTSTRTADTGRLQTISTNFFNSQNDFLGEDTPYGYRLFEQNLQFHYNNVAFIRFRWEMTIRSHQSLAGKFLRIDEYFGWNPSVSASIFTRVDWTEGSNSNGNRYTVYRVYSLNSLDDFNNGQGGDFRVMAVWENN